MHAVRGRPSSMWWVKQYWRRAGAAAAEVGALAGDTSVSSAMSPIRSRARVSRTVAALLAIAIPAAHKGGLIASSNQEQPNGTAQTRPARPVRQCRGARVHGDERLLRPER